MHHTVAQQFNQTTIIRQDSHQKRLKTSQLAAMTDNTVYATQPNFFYPNSAAAARALLSASEMTYIVSSGALNSTHSLTHSVVCGLYGYGLKCI